MSGFWERRKAAVAQEARAEEEALVAAEIAEQEQALAEQSDEELLAQAGLKEPEALESAEEVQDFLRAALPQRLKTRALRRLWRLNPVLANLDGLIDYGEDFTDSAVVVENMATVYQVGKGMFDKAVEAAKEAEAKAERALTEAAASEPEESDAVTEAPIAQSAPEPDPATPETPHNPEQDSDTAAPVLARRMRFHFDETPATGGQERTDRV